MKISDLIHVEKKKYLLHRKPVFEANIIDEQGDPIRDNLSGSGTTKEEAIANLISNLRNYVKNMDTHKYWLSKDNTLFHLYYRSGWWYDIVRFKPDGTRNSLDSSACGFAKEKNEIDATRDVENHLKQYDDSYCVPGVIHMNDCNDEIYDFIQHDVAWNATYNEYLTSCPEDTPIEEWIEYYEPEGEDLLVGSWRQDKTGQWLVNHNGNSGYAAVVNDDGYIQVIWSKHFKQCRPCSPCYPNQGDLTTEGSLWTYSLPPHLMQSE